MARLPLAREGWPFVLAGLALVLLLALLQLRAAAAAAALPALFLAWFFRDPERAIPTEPAAIVSPADGRIIEVAPELGGGTKVSVFLSIFDVHVNRAPVAGEVADVTRRPGKFLAAWKHAASTENARTSVTVRTGRGDVRFVQVAGLVARRIVCRLAPGDRVERGARYGLIRFGSRTDLHLPATAVPAVKVGDRVRGGADVIARWKEGP